ncbi:hypothetical protein Hypma_003384 [Hypsizygus marmoreus]|uniref:Uncharacterized protein n=1 Tax=Hypsizygus marmoreus TaxID=39966 RepID=A0A369JB78_HYPMA|nr:hypothetical protein Hypma_003384 [Hypsizygus marmoreus]
MSATARVLGTAELLDLITSFLRSYQSDLFCMAQVSKSFSFNAISHLWRALRSPLPLIRLIPAIARRKSRYEHEFFRAPLEAEWGPFLKYSHLVYEMEDIYGLQVVALGTYAQISKYRSGKVFPSLRVIAFQALDRERLVDRNLRAADTMALLASPNLTRVHICHYQPSERYAKSDADTVAGYITQLTASAHALRHLHISGHFNADNTIHHLTKLRHLNHLDLNFDQSPHHSSPPSRLKSLDQLASLQGLTTLLLNVPPSNFTLPTARLDGLKTLAIISHLSSFEKICGIAPNVEHLILRVNQPPSSREMACDWHDLYRALRYLCPSIRRLEIRNGLQDKSTFSVLEHIEPLFAFALEGLHISSPGVARACLSDDDAAKIGLAWPQLRHLDLFSDAHYAHGPGKVPTGQMIFTLSRLCQNLNFVRIHAYVVARLPDAEISSVVAVFSSSKGTYVPFGSTLWRPRPSEQDGTCQRNVERNRLWHREIPMSITRSRVCLGTRGERITEALDKKHPGDSSGRSSSTGSSRPRTAPKREVKNLVMASEDEVSHHQKGDRAPKAACAANEVPKAKGSHPNMTTPNSKHPKDATVSKERKRTSHENSLLWLQHERKYTGNTPETVDGSGARREWPPAALKAPNSLPIDPMPGLSGQSSWALTRGVLTRPYRNGTTTQVVIERQNLGHPKVSIPLWSQRHLSLKVTLRSYS